MNGHLPFNLGGGNGSKCPIAAVRRRKQIPVRTTLSGLLVPVGRCPRLCENTQELTRRRIVFSIALFPTTATALFIFKLTKSRSIFYAKIERLCFHTAWPRSGHCRNRTRTARLR